ncbi:hypothetical protein SUGI_0122560 [Cryptomeria japonica]|nr:hypothetical protein SUGI_0122560 [Cryptomeria japonica]
MASLSQIIKEDRHPVWLVDALILSAVAYSRNPQEELSILDGELGLPKTAKYQFFAEEELRNEGFGSSKQVLLVVKSLACGHMIVACRGTTGFLDALTDLNMMQRSMSLGVGAAHAGFLDRAKSIPLKYFRRLLIRGENVVLTGHSLGGAVASLLTLRLLEITPRWCHEQLQCYTFGCPFFADSALAKHINKRYKKHFVHIVSRNDIVPKVMPVAHALYTLWAGLAAGPLEDLFNVARLGLFIMQAVLKVLKRRNDTLGAATVATQAASWLPWLARGLVHRLLALALSMRSGSGYTFAGQMVLLDAEKSLEEEEMLCDTTPEDDIERHLTLKLTHVSMDGMKEHSLLSYIDSVFSISQSDEPEYGSPLEVHRTALNVTSGREIDDQIRSPKLSKLKNVLKKREKKPKAFRSKVACLIFARRMQETSPIILKRKKNQKKRLVGVLGECIGKLGRFAQRWNTLFLASSLYYVVRHFRRFLPLK